MLATGILSLPERELPQDIKASTGRAIARNGRDPRKTPDRSGKGSQPLDLAPRAHLLDY